MRKFPFTGFPDQARQVADALSLLKRNGIHIQIPDELKSVLAPDTLFDGGDGMFKELAKNATVYFEYGCGKSTWWVYRSTDAQIRSVDTSREWLGKVRALLGAGSEERVELQWVDVGPLGEWGKPASLARRGQFRDYTDWPWTLGLAPDLVLVDGRFRIASFLTTLQRATEGTIVLFDDYADRPIYHVAEEFAPVMDRCGRQVAFQVDKAAKAKATDAAIEQFRNVLD